MTVTDKSAALQSFYDSLDGTESFPLWLELRNLFSREPAVQAVPHLWHYDAIRNKLLEVAPILSAQEAERRVLMLVNPALKDRSATVNTLFAGIQLILGHETAPAHRHQSNAFRFIVEGTGAYTTVNGEPVSMRPRDLLLTPGWAWHDHVNEADDWMCWLDGLDFPLVNLMESSFFQLYHERQQETTVPANHSERLYAHGRLNPRWDVTDATAKSPLACYPWADTEKALRDISSETTGSATDGVILEFTNPLNGGPVMPTISCRIQQLAPRFHTDAVRRTSSAIYHVVQGEGRSIVGGQELVWGERDIFCVPNWATVEHENTSGSEPAILFSYTDEPVQRALGYWREEFVASQG